MSGNKVLDIIKEFLLGIKNNSIECENEGELFAINSPRYLLGQILRQYQISEDHFFISNRAKNLWDMICTDDISNYSYTDLVKCDKDCSIRVKSYVGGSNSYQEIELKKGKQFPYRSIFHDEHIIPINMIIDELLRIQEQDLTYTNIKNVLDNIYICRILKEEDRNIKEKKKRALCLIETVKGSYFPSQIDIINWNKIEQEYKNAHNCSNCTGCTKLWNKNEFCERNAILDGNTTMRNKSDFTTYKFIVRCTQTTIDRLAGYDFYDTNGRKLGIIFPTQDKRTPAYGKCEMRFYPEYEQEFCRWHRIKIGGQRLSYNELCDILKHNDEHLICIDR